MKLLLAEQHMFTIQIIISSCSCCIMVVYVLLFAGDIVTCGMWHSCKCGGNVMHHRLYLPLPAVPTGISGDGCWVYLLCVTIAVPVLCKQRVPAIVPLAVMQLV